MSEQSSQKKWVLVKEGRRVLDKDSKTAVFTLEEANEAAAKLNSLAESSPLFERVEVKEQIFG